MHKRLLMVTPYAPGGSHFHAAADLAEQLALGLSREFELHVAAPGNDSLPNDAFTRHSLPAPDFSWRSYFGVVPAASRMDWSAAATASVTQLIGQLNPHHVHFEYLQTAETALALRRRSWSFTLHDIGERVFFERARTAQGLERLYRNVEANRVRRYERHVIESAGQVFVLSETDAEHVQSLGRDAAVINVGAHIPPEEWRWAPAESPVLVFAGAMSRDTNARAARWLVSAVMPLIWKEIPTARLRLVGDGSEDVMPHGPVDSRVELVGRVHSFEEEFAASSVVLAPSLVGAGILLKAVKGMAVGAPVVLNAHSAAPFRRVSGEIALIGDTDDEFAAAAIALVRDARMASAIGARARDYIRSQHPWSSAVRAVSTHLVDAR